MTQVPAIQLSDGTSIPQIGFGTWRIPDSKVTGVVLAALEAGYRHIDTAAIYGNERGVGRAIAASGIPRDELYITTKLWNDAHLTADARRGIENSLMRLGLDRLDLYLIHWPATLQYGDSYIEAWDALQQFKAEGLTRSIGVSNFLPHHLDALSGETPAVDQIEVHPTFSQRALRDELTRRGITIQSYSPLGSGADLRNRELARIGARHSKSVSQVIIRWHLQHGLVVLPKSQTPIRVRENFDVLDFELDAHAMSRIDALDGDNRVGWHPDTARL